MAFPWMKVLCPIDFSDPARAAMRAAVEVCRLTGGELTLFHAYELPGYTLPEGSVVASPKMLQDLSDQAEVHLAEWKKLAEGMGAAKVRVEKGIGEPALSVVELAQERGFDLIVVGTHGRTGLRHALLGSVAERVVRRAGCPVLTIHPEGYARRA
ncbi:universal stress protein [Anaeromyxobacter diazotrophicus]|uniref:Universal stress protein UspA n=1 Tax=Anaeromyxobacter diazotrophicus TaxID=2590199 RepID=A0A7I9VSL7_9BACT|nr:universal stress protein [Anaeromyxobacter diazotrophicus]GEJ59079.1 universal stress protein UspA [Anaeromyxobacter diazotrophicus]